MRLLLFLAIVTAASAGAFSQTKTAVKRSTPAKPATAVPKADQPVPAGVPAKKGTSLNAAEGRTYANDEFGFAVTFPSTWLIPGDDFESEMKKAGFDLGLNPPQNVAAVDRIRMNRALEKVKVLLTAYRSMPGSDSNAIVRISTEDLSDNPQVKDAVDYFDAMRSQFAGMKLPPDFKYSETGAEKLGRHQFAYLDTSSDAGNKRLYATVRKGHAILFSISYSRDEDLQVLRRVLSEGNFARR